MYLYFDNNGILKEIVDDVATRKGNNEVNKIYIYVDGITPKTEWITYQTSDGVQSNETLIETTITKTIPYDRNRDLKYFKNFQEYLFYVATIPSSVLTVSGLTKASVRVALQDDSLMTLGLIIFTIEESVVLQDSFITESQYQYLLNIISNFEELDNTGVIGITTQIVNGAVAPYDQGRIVLSTYNDNFTIATVVKNSTGQNVYNVLDMTFVKQVPFNSSNPNLEGLEINGKKYKVAYNTSQLNNDAGFITNAVSNLINYYTKTTIDEKLANIDLSDYYTKTESDGRYVLTTNFSWNNLANKPTSLSDFINDEGFITNTVSNLTNYYDKTTIDTIVATLKTGAFQVVSELPSSGAEGIVYLVGTEAPYTMYIWENNAFLNIGTTEVNLDGYVKGTNLNTNYVILGNGGSNVVASIYTINNQNANDPNSLLTAKVINTLLGTKQDVLTQGQGINISDNVVSTPVSTTSTTISQQSVNNLKYDGKPILVDYAINDDSGRNIVDTYATFNDLHALDIGDITSSSNIYQTLYQNVYENDTTKKNVVIFSTDGFVDSATSLISSGDHTATPYQDNKILIDSVFVLNSDNSATSIVSSDTVVIDLGTLAQEGGTLSPTILSKIHDAISENKNISIKAILDGTMTFPNVTYGGNNLYCVGYLYIGSDLFAVILNITLITGQYVTGLVAVQDKLVSGTNIKTVNGQTILGSGNIEISGGGESNSITIALGELSSTGGTLSSEILAQINNNLGSKSISFEGTSDGISFTTSSYSTAGNSVAISFLAGNVVLTLVITLTTGNYTISQTIFLDSVDTKTINNQSLLGAGNISVQDKLVSGTNIKTVNGQSLVGSGNISVQEKLVSGSNIKTVNGETILGSGNVPVQEPLVSGTNIKTVNGQSLLGAGNIEISGGSGSATKMLNLGTLTDSGTLDAGKFQELLTLYQNGDLIQVIFDYKVGAYITASAYSIASSSIGIVAHGVSNSLNAVNLSINTTNGNYTITPIEIPTHFKTINGNTITGGGNIFVQEQLVSGTNIKTINNKSILGSGNIDVQERLLNAITIRTINGQTLLSSGDIKTGLPAQQYTISNLNFNNFSVGQSVNISASDSAIIENARTNKASVIFSEVNLQYLPLLYVEAANDVQVLYNDLLGHCGVVSINTTNNTATVLSVFNTESKSTINLNTISNTKTNYDNIFNYLTDQGFARAYFNVEGFLDQANSIGNEQYYEAYLSGDNKYFASCGKIYEYIVDTSSQGFHVELVGNSLFRPISKNTLRMLSSKDVGISTTSTLTNVSILLGANVSKGQRKYTFDNPRMNFQFNSNFNNSFAFDTSRKKIDIAESIYTKLFTWSYESNTVVPTVSSTHVSTWYPTNWHKGTTANQNITATILDFSNLPSGTTYNEFFNGFHEFPKAIYYKFNNGVGRYQEYRTFRFSLRFVFDYQGVSISSGDQLYYDRKWTGTLQNKYLEVIARLDYTNKQVVIYQRIRTFA